MKRFDIVIHKVDLRKIIVLHIDDFGTFKGRYSNPITGEYEIIEFYQKEVQNA